MGLSNNEVKTLSILASVATSLKMKNILPLAVVAAFAIKFWED